MTKKYIHNLTNRVIRITTIIIFICAKASFSQTKSVKLNAIEDSILIEKILLKQQNSNYNNETIPAYEEYNELRKDIHNKNYIWLDDNVNFKEANNGKNLSIKKNSKWSCKLILIRKDKLHLAVNEVIDENENSEAERDTSWNYIIVANFTDKIGNMLAFTYEQVEYNNYRKEITVNKNSTLYSLKEESVVIKSNNEEKLKNEAELKLKKQREQLVKQKQYENIKLYGQVNGDIINKKELKIGFSKQMCLASWGKPISIKTITTIEGKIEYWNYASEKKLVFQNGKLTRIEDNE